MGKSKKLTTLKVQDIYSGLVRLLRAGLKPVEALRRLGLEESHPEPFFAEAAEHVKQGDSLATALREGAPDIFPDRDLAMLEAAELTNAYVETLERLMNDHRRRAAVITRFLSKIIYPTILVHAAAVACVVYMVINEISPLPLIGVGICLVPFYIAVFMGWHFIKHYWIGLRSRDRFMRYPVLMKIIKDSELGNFFRLLYTLYGAGVRLSEAATQAAGLIRTHSIREQVSCAVATLDEGNPFADCLKDLGLPEEAYVMRLRIGEETGNLEEALKETGEELAERAQKKATSLLVKFSFLITAIAYIGVAVIAIGHYLVHYSKLLAPLG